MANIQDTVARLFPEVESFRAKRLSSTFPTPMALPGSRAQTGAWL